ncbi:hypothetical protein IU471_22630 [Nocardia elegans]|nr:MULTISPECIES: hypothetical protein [Nocardia]MBF6246365.1 hypothetical protein [Nocardia elegans]MBF6314907.1 hypothetical protein [Nocardia farcinica]
MSSGSGSLWPVAVPIAVSVVVNVVVAIVVNLATGGGPWWMWVLIAVLTVVGIATAIWQYRKQQSSTPLAEPARSVEASGARSVAVGGNAGWISTGDNSTAPQTVPTPPPSTASPAPGSVTASGERSAAVGGDAGGVTTGDQ